MNCDCSDKLLLEIKQGTNRSYGFTIKKLENPFDLTGYTILVEIKPSPYFSVPSLITKEITEDSDETTIGSIYNPTEGQFKLKVAIEDYIKFPPRDYYLIVTMVKDTNRIIISGEGQASGIFRIVKQ